MRKKIARQTDLITSLERSELRKNDELVALRRKLREQEDLIAQIRKERELEEAKNGFYPQIIEPPVISNAAALPVEDIVVLDGERIPGVAIVDEASQDAEDEDPDNGSQVEADGELQIFDDPAVVPNRGAGTDRSESELEEDGVPFDKWHNRDYQDYYKQLQKRHKINSDVASREELEKQALDALRNSDSQDQ